MNNPAQKRRVNAAIEKAVLTALGLRARYAELRKRLPYTAESVSKALSRLKRKGTVVIGRDHAGEFWERVGQ